MSNPAKLHTPYDGSAKPFTIGLKPLDLTEWIDFDAMLPRYLDEKQRLTREEYKNIVVSEAGSEDAQQEVLDLISDHLCTHFPQSYTRTGDVINILPAGRTVDLSDKSVTILHRAASLIQEDLVIMRKGENGWRLVAASLCFPSAWSLNEKFGKPMHEIHAPVPGFGSGTRNAELIERMFDNLRIEQPVIRWNWSLYGDDRLYHPDGGHEGKLRFGTSTEPENINLRLERQTLRKLPVTKDLLFTIRIYIDPLRVLQSHIDGPMLTRHIMEQLSALSHEEITYKGLKDERTRLLQHLERLAGLPT
ncbi:MAG: heme-dependent oxidative N-demethylase family protein [Rhizobiaceae bacterium]